MSGVFPFLPAWPGPGSSAPVVEDTATGGGQGGLNYDMALPTGITSGETLIGFISMHSAVGFTWPGGWTELIDHNGSNVDFSIGYKKATGSEGSSITITGSAAGAWLTTCYRISGASDPTVLPPEKAVVSNGTGTSSTHNALTPYNGQKNYLWLAFTCGQPAGNCYPYSLPTNYTGLIEGQTSTIWVDHARANAHRYWPAESEKPDGFGFNGTGYWQAITAVIHPA